MLRRLSLRRCRLLSYRHSAASCPLTHPLPFASCLPAGCRVTASASQLCLADLLFASSLSRCPCCRAAAASCPLAALPMPRDIGTSALRRSTSASRCATTSCPLAPLLLFTSRSLAGCHVTSRHAAASRSCPSSTLTFMRTGWLSRHISSRCPRHAGNSPPFCLSFAPTGCLCV